MRCIVSTEPPPEFPMSRTYRTISVALSSLGLTVESIPHRWNIASYSARLILVMVLGVPISQAYIEIIKFSSSMPVSGITASASEIPSAISSF